MKTEYAAPASMYGLVVTGGDTRTRRTEIAQSMKRDNVTIECMGVTSLEDFVFAAFVDAEIGWTREVITQPKITHLQQALEFADADSLVVSDLGLVERDVREKIVDFMRTFVEHTDYYTFYTLEDPEKLFECDEDLRGVVKIYDLYDENPNIWYPCKVMLIPFPRLGREVHRK